MRLEECYRLLDLPPDASPEDVKHAYRDLTKVWHPDRFAHDAQLRQRAEEKLKAINDAYATILNSSGERVAATTRVSGWAIAFALLAVFVMLRRPTALGAIIAALLFAAALTIFLRRRRRSS